MIKSEKSHLQLFSLILLYQSGQNLLKDVQDRLISERLNDYICQIRERDIKKAT